MPRVRIDLPETFLFTTEITVRVTDLNYGAHLGNDTMLSLIHEARVQFLRAFGMNEKDAGGVSIIMADAAIVYRAEAFAGDCLRFDVTIGELSRAGCDLLYRVTRASDGRLVAEVKTGIAFLDIESRKLTALPDAIRRLAQP
jgi:acyl-CoA thioester hydrolase